MARTLRGPDVGSRSQGRIRLCYLNRDKQRKRQREKRRELTVARSSKWVSSVFIKQNSVFAVHIPSVSQLVLREHWPLSLSSEESCSSDLLSFPIMLHGERRGESPPYDWLPPEKRLCSSSTSYSCCCFHGNDKQQQQSI